MAAPNSEQHLFSVQDVSLSNNFNPAFMASNNLELNSLATFRQSLELAKEQIKRINTLANSVVSGIQEAYTSSSSAHPAQTAANYVELQSNIVTLCAFLRQTGVGALPIYPMESISTGLVGPLWTEQTAIDAAQSSYSQRLRIQQNAAVVASLLESQSLGTGIGVSQSSVRHTSIDNGIGRNREAQKLPFRTVAE